MRAAVTLQRAGVGNQMRVRAVGIGAVETVPAGIAVLTAYTLTAGLGWFGLPTDQAVVDIDDTRVRTELFDVAEAGTEDTNDATGTGPQSQGGRET